MLNSAASTSNSLATKEDRRQWEIDFNTHYIQPVLEELDRILSETMDVIAKDDKQGTYISFRGELC